MMRIRLLTAALAAMALAGCVTAPPGPSVMALPGKGKTFDQFRADDYECRGFASQQSGGQTANQASTNSAVTTAAVGTALGAAAGALIGGHNSTGVGAGAGLLAGTLGGAGAAQATASTVQQRYDNAYIQCMYAKGEQVPLATQTRERREYEPRRRMEPPPPPSGYPPPPPPY